MPCILDHCLEITIIIAYELQKGSILRCSLWVTYLHESFHSTEQAPSHGEASSTSFPWKGFYQAAGHHFRGLYRQISPFMVFFLLASGNILSISEPWLTSIILFKAWIPCTSLPHRATLLSYCASYCNEFLMYNIVCDCCSLAVFLYPGKVIEKPLEVLVKEKKSFCICFVAVDLYKNQLNTLLLFCLTD